MPEVTLLEIARRLGVSKTAVSLALRGKPGLSAETADRILNLARELGYAPNPVSAELMALVRSRRTPATMHTVAFLNTLKVPSQMRQIEGIWDFVTGAEKRAVQYGYRVEVFESQAPGMTVSRLADIFLARGIRGILVGPSWATDPPLGFPWEKFSAVVVGDPERGDHLHRVCHHHIHGCLTALRTLAARGYRNIGVVLHGRNQRNTGHGYSLGVEQFRREAPRGVKATTWIYEEWDETAASEWAQKIGADAIVALDLFVGEHFTRSRTASGNHLGFAFLNLPSKSPWSGINQHTEAIGAASVDLLRGLLLSGERGIAVRPQILLVDGEWVEGSTSPGPRNGNRGEASVRRRSSRKLEPQTA